MELTQIAIPRQVGLCVRRAREAQGLSRAWLSSESGVSERTIASLELGDASGIRLDKLLAVLQPLGLSLAICSEEVPGPQVVAQENKGHQAPILPEHDRATPTYQDELRDFLRRQGIDVPDDSNEPGIGA